MPSTMDLLTEALASPNAPSAAEWCRRLGVNRTALSVCRARGRLSPTIAGSLAEQMGKNPTEWIAIAALEAEPESTAKEKLMQRLNGVAKR